MNRSLLPLARRGIAAPYLITPETDAEASTGRATLIAVGDIRTLIAGVKKVAPDDKLLIKKLERLR